MAGHRGKWGGGRDPVTFEPGGDQVGAAAPTAADQSRHALGLGRGTRAASVPSARRRALASSTARRNWEVGLASGLSGEPNRPAWPSWNYSVVFSVQETMHLFGRDVFVHKNQLQESGAWVRSRLIPALQRHCWQSTESTCEKGAEQGRHGSVLRCGAQQVRPPPGVRGTPRASSSEFCSFVVRFGGAERHACESSGWCLVHAPTCRPRSSMRKSSRTTAVASAGSQAARRRARNFGEAGAMTCSGLSDMPQ